MLDWQHVYKLGEVERAVRHRGRALVLYRKALARNPSCALCYLGIAEVDFDTGKDPDPWIARAVEFGRANTDVRLRAAILLARMGDHERAAGEFGAALAGRRSDRQDLFALLHRIYDDEFVIDRIVTD